MKKAFVLVTLLVSSSCFSQALTFKENGKNLLSIEKSDLKNNKLSINNHNFSIQSTKLFNAWRGYEKTYMGFDLFSLLDHIYGTSWRKGNKLIFRAIDGYSPFIRIKKMLKLVGENSHVGILSIKEIGNKGFTSFKRADKSIDPGPYYLVWTNFTNEAKANYGDVLKWPYQLSEIELVTK